MTGTKTVCPPPPPPAAHMERRIPGSPVLRQVGSHSEKAREVSNIAWEEHGGGGGGAQPLLILSNPVHRPAQTSKPYLDADEHSFRALGEQADPLAVAQPPCDCAGDLVRVGCVPHNKVFRVLQHDGRFGSRFGSMFQHISACPGERGRRERRARAARSSTLRHGGDGGTQCRCPTQPTHREPHVPTRPGAL